MAKEVKLNINKFLGLWYDNAGDTNIPVGSFSQLQNFQMLPNYKLRKRSGCSSLLDTVFETPIMGQWHGKLNGKNYHVVATGGKAYVVDQKTKLDIGNLTDAETNMFQFGDAIYFQNGTDYKKFTGVELVDESEVNFNSTDYSGAYPKILTLPKANYRLKLGGGKGEDKTLKIGSTTYTGYGGKGGIINFRLNLEAESVVRIEKITNGSETYRTSFHVYVNDVLYAAVGGGGDASLYGMSTSSGYLGAMNNGGDGGGDIADDGKMYSMGTPAKGANKNVGGEGMTASVTSPYNSNPPDNGADYPISTGGVDDKARGGCGYAGGGGGGYASTKTESYYWYGSGAGGSSFVITDGIFLYENSKGTNNGAGYITINTIREYLSLEDVDGHIPTVQKGTKPDGTNGTAYEPINSLTGKRKQTFNGDNAATKYVLAEKNNTSVDAVKVGGVIKTVTSHYTVNASNDEITFTTGNIPPEGIDNVEIAYTHDADTDRAEAVKYTHARLYGGKNDNRVFLFGNGNRIIYSDLADGVPSAEYFPVMNTMDIGSSQYDVMDLSVQYDRMLIHKERGTWWTQYDYDTTLLMANFPVYPLNDNIGSSYKGTARICENNPFVLQDKQLYEFVASNVRDERNVRYLSERVQPLLNQLDFANTITLDYEKFGEYWIVDGNKAYIYNYRLDGWFYYYFANNITSAIVKDGVVVLGTDDGDLLAMDGSLDDNGTLINAFAETGWIDYGYSAMRKFLNFMWVQIFPESDTSAEIYYQVDRGALRLVKEISYKNINFEDVDFADFSFATNYNPKSFRLKPKAKKFVYIKFSFINNKRNKLTLLGLNAPSLLGGQSK